VNETRDEGRRDDEAVRERGSVRRVEGVKRRKEGESGLGGKRGAREYCLCFE
jgi:hypothetical protein